MNLQIDLRSFFLILAAVQALVISTLLVFRGIRKGRLSDQLLAAFLISLAATLGEHIAGWMNWYQSQALTFFPFGNNFLFAPLAYLYIKSITNINYRLKGREWLHFTPALVYFVLHFLIWPMAVPAKLALIQKLGLLKYFYVEGAIDLIIITTYSVLAVRHYRAYLKWLPSEFSNLQPVTLKWFRNFLVILSAVCVIEWGFSLTSLFYEYWYDVRYWDYFIRAVLLYYVSVAGYTFTARHEIIFSSQSNTETNQTEVKNENDLLPTQLLLDHMHSVKPYLDPELTLSQLAQELKLSTAIVSRTINAGLDKNFNDFINEYRVNEICLHLKAGQHKTKTLLGVALDCGFNSKATFNRSFKKLIGLAPKEWIEQNVSE
ncbi:helix-turn-helix domain-containing protein [soil metagenome]